MFDVNSTQLKHETLIVIVDTRGQDVVATSTESVRRKMENKIDFH